MTIVEQTVASAVAKIKEGMDGGPYGDDVILTPSECCVLYRLLAERKTSSAKEADPI